MALSRIIFSIPLLYQQLFYCPVPPPEVEEVPPFSYVDVTTHQAFRRTLFYQANINPPPTAELQQEAAAATPDKWLQRWQGPPRYWPIKQQAIPFVPEEAVLENTQTPDKWLLSWKGPPKYQPNRGPFATGPIEPPAPPEVVDTINSATGITTGGISRKTLFYQSKIAPVGVPAAEVVITTVEWIPPFTRAVSRAPTETGLYTPFVPAQAPAVTADEWLPAWAAPLREPTRLASGQPFVPKEAVLENTVDQGWRRPFSEPVDARPVWRTQPFYGFPYEGIDNTRTQWDWQISWKGPPRYWWQGRPFQPFIPKEATRENTVPGGWWQPLSPPVAPRPVWYTQPFYGYPYEAEVVTPPVTFTVGQAQLFKRTLQYQSSPFVPAPAAAAVTPDEWLISWQGPPRRLQRLQPGSPFVPKAAVLENTVDQGWRRPFSEPVDARPVWRTQPFYGYPYEVQAIVVPYAQWWHQPLSRAAATPPVRRQPFQPFVARAAVLENTVTPDKWLISWKGPPRYWPLGKPFQPFVPTAVVETPVTPDKWLMRWQGPPRYQPAKILAQGFVPREAVRENTQTPDKWLIRFQQAVPHGWPTHTQPFFGYPYVDLYPEGGPADESERVACVPLVSRVATPPALLRTVTVPLQVRLATVPRELSCSEFVVASEEVTEGTGSGYYGRRYYGRHYYGPHYWGGSLDSGGSTVTEAGEGYFGHRYFAGRYFGPHYWGGSLESGTTTTTVSGNGYYGGRYYGRYYYGARYWGGATSTVTIGATVELLRVVCVPYSSRTVRSNDYRDRPCHDT